VFINNQGDTWLQPVGLERLIVGLRVQCSAGRLSVCRGGDFPQTYLEDDFPKTVLDSARVGGTVANLTVRPTPIIHAFDALKLCDSVTARTGHGGP